ncbi:MAG: nitrous oxide reductase family maturation protein NosD [Deltaproteobacteria bacterium]|nr:nitrous oxide reductase family maturation protein NosD [Deltaproteobacteria bacterium]
MRQQILEGLTLVVVGVLSAVATAASGEAALVRAATGAGSLQALVDRAEPGHVLELGPGTYAGPVRIDKALILRGRGSVIDGGGVGTPLVVVAPGVRVEGVVVQGSGDDVGAPDACIYVEPSATGTVLQGNTLRDCAFGIWVHETDGVHIEGNRIWGRKDVRVTDRGNGIHLFNASHLVVRDNEVRDARDGIYVSVTEDSVIEDNLAEHVRFGVHYMYSYRNVLRGNVMNHNTLGIALMESHDLIVEDNRAAGNRRQGLLFRDVRGSQIRRNRLERNGQGMFFYSSTENVIEDNVVQGNEMGLKIWAGTRRNRIEGNVIRGNREQVFYVGAEDQIWGESGRGNYWGDYLGWDQDGDGIGDRPHRVDSFAAGLLYRYPSAALLLRSPALETLSHLADRLPMLRTPTIIDQAPLLGEPES